MYSFHPYFTLDGSVGLYNEDYNDIYHSATGALTEAYEKFILPIDVNWLYSLEEIKVLDICYGIGYNSKSFLNFILKNFSQKNFQKKSNSTDTDIVPIYTNNNSVQTLTNNTETIYGDKIFDKISITAIDNDKILAFLSPFIKTGEKNIKEENLDFKYPKIEKYLKRDKKIKVRKISKIINYLIFEKIARDYPEIFDNSIVASLLSSNKHSIYFERNLTPLYSFYKSKRIDYSPRGFNIRFLHNIYYRYVTNCYKRSLKRYNLQDINFKYKNGDARKIIQTDNQSYNLIFLDAFTPSKCPCLWSLDFFKLLFEHMDYNGLLLTYSTAASARNAMLTAGFKIGNIINNSENKIIGTIATKNPELIKSHLSEFDLGLLKTKAGIFYRDTNLSLDNESIIKNRNIEANNSTLMSSSGYKKRFKL